MNRPLVCGLLFLLSSAGFLFTAPRLSWPKEVYYRGTAADYWDNERCSFNAAVSDEGKRFFFGSCEGFNFDAATNHLTMSLSIRIGFDVIYTDLQIIPLDNETLPSCALDIAILPESLKYGSPAGLYLRGLPKDPMNITQELVEVELPCSEFSREDVRNGVWEIRYTAHYRMHKTRGLGPISEEYNANGTLVADREGIEHVGLLRERELASDMRVQRAAQLRNLSNKAIPTFFFALAISSLALLVYCQRKGP